MSNSIPSWAEPTKLEREVKIEEQTQAQVPNGPIVNKEVETVVATEELKQEGDASSEKVLEELDTLINDNAPFLRSLGPINSALKKDTLTRPLTEADLGKGIIQAKSLAMPEALSLKPKDSNIMFRWVNFKTEEGARVYRHRSMGFEIAQIEDVEGALPMESNHNPIGITNYDVVLMKIDKMRLLQAYEYNLQKSKRMVSKKDSHDLALNKAVAQLRQDMAANGTPLDYIQGRVGYFTPSATEAEALNK